MKKMKKGSKGFTLTELAIVIAVIAILIAVLVPTFVSLIDKANKTSDNILVSNVNEVLAVDETTNGTPATIDDALAAAEAAGYNVSNLSTSSSGTLIVWNETSNEFIYVNSELDSSGNFTEVDGEAVTTDTSSNLWVITSSYNSTYEAYSQYISGTVEAGTTLEVKAGVSVGDNEDVNITYTNGDGKAKTVTFVTNGGTLTVNDAYATVNQYGAVSKVVVTAVDAANSFHANGEVEGNIEIKEGHLVIEDGSDADKVYITGSDVTIDNKSSNKVYAACSSTEIANKLSSIIKSGDVDTSTPVIDSTLAGYFAGGFGTEENPFMISTAKQFANIYNVSSNASKYNYNSTNKVYYKLTNEIDLTEGDLVTLTNGSVYPTYGGLLYYSVLDGDNNTVGATNILYSEYSTYIYALFYEVIDSDIKNMTVEMGNNTYSMVWWLKGTSTYTNVDTTGSISFSGGNIGLYSIYTQGNITFKDCTNYATVMGSGTNESYNAIFVGYCTTSWDLDVTFISCENAGKLVCGKAAMFIGNLCNAANVVSITITDCKNTGTIRSTYQASGYTPNYYIASGGVASTGTFIVDGKNCITNTIPALSNTFNGPDDTLLSITLNKDGYYAITESSISGANTYVISVGLYTNVYEQYGSGTSRYYVTITVSADQFADGSYTSILTNLKFMDLATYKSTTGDTQLSNITKIDNGDGGYNYTATVSGVTYYLVNNEQYYFNNDSGTGTATSFSVSVYDKDGNLLSSASM